MEEVQQRIKELKQELGRVVEKRSELWATLQKRLSLAEEERMLLLRRGVLAVVAPSCRMLQWTHHATMTARP